jgi:hypothetical protein
VPCATAGAHAVPVPPGHRVTGSQQPTERNGLPGACPTRCRPRSPLRKRWSSRCPASPPPLPRAPAGRGRATSDRIRRVGRAFPAAAPAAVPFIGFRYQPAQPGRAVGRRPPAPGCGDVETCTCIVAEFTEGIARLSPAGTETGVPAGAIRPRSGRPLAAPRAGRPPAARLGLLRELRLLLVTSSPGVSPARPRLGVGALRAHAESNRDKDSDDEGYQAEDHEQRHRTTQHAMAKLFVPARHTRPLTRACTRNAGTVDGPGMHTRRAILADSMGPVTRLVNF